MVPLDQRGNLVTLYPERNAIMQTTHKTRVVSLILASCAATWAVARAPDSPLTLWGADVSVGTVFQASMRDTDASTAAWSPSPRLNYAIGEESGLAQDSFMKTEQIGGTVDIGTLSSVTSLLT